MIAENVKKYLAAVAGGNPMGEPVTLVAATKTRTPEEINEAIAAGIRAVGENKVQEFTAKYEAVQGAERHFIGHLQTNKVKYLVGKTQLIQSLDRTELADELQKRAEKANWTADCLLEVNIGSELSKSGFSLEEAPAAYKKLRAFPNIRLMGPVPSVEVPDCLAACDVCFDLLRLDRMGSDILSPQLYEYFSTGKPVVTMLAPNQVEVYPDVVYAAYSAPGFLRCCGQAVQEDPNWVSRRRKEYSAAASWTLRAQEIDRILETAALF